MYKHIIVFKLCGSCLSLRPMGHPHGLCYPIEPTPTHGRLFIFIEAVRLSSGAIVPFNLSSRNKLEWS